MMRGGQQAHKPSIAEAPRRQQASRRREQNGAGYIGQWTFVGGPLLLRGHQAITDVGFLISGAKNENGSPDFDALTLKMSVIHCGAQSRVYKARLSQVHCEGEGSGDGCKAFGGAIEAYRTHKVREDPAAPIEAHGTHKVREDPAASMKRVASDALLIGDFSIGGLEAGKIDVDICGWVTTASRVGGESEVAAGPVLIDAQQAVNQLKQFTSETPGTMEDVQAMLQSLGVKEFYREQLQVIQACYERKNAFFVAPTGYGKTLCFATIALLRKSSGGVCAVITPMKALQDDHYRKLKHAGALVLNGDTQNRARALRDLSSHDSSVNLLFLGPEQLRRDDLLKALNTRGVSAWAVDECHTLSWGIDFRPDFNRIRQVARSENMVKQYPLIGAPILMCTATLTQGLKTTLDGVMTDATNQPAEEIVVDLDRPEIQRSVVRCPPRPAVCSRASAAKGSRTDKPPCGRCVFCVAVEQNPTFPSRFHIVFMNDKKACFNMAVFCSMSSEAEMQDRIFLAYHASMDAQTKSAILRVLIAIGNCGPPGFAITVFATSCLGMGVDLKEIDKVSAVGVQFSNSQVHNHNSSLVTCDRMP